MIRVEYRPTRPDDLVRFGLSLEQGARAIGWTGWVGRRAVGLGGVILSPTGEAWGHFAAVPDYRGLILRGLHKRTLRLLRRLDLVGIRDIRAVCDLDMPRAAEWMARLGFAATADVHDGQTLHVRTR